MEKLTLELVESRLQELSKKHKLDIMDEKLLVLYCKKFGTQNWKDYPENFIGEIV